MDLFDARSYLKIDIANSFGLDKLSWTDRIAWFDAHQNQLLTLLQQAESPALFYAGIQAWHDVLKGDPIGYPVSLDATSSGLQILAVLTGDRSAAELCNVVDTGERRDAYTSVYQHMLAKVGEGAKIKREDTKQAIMTSLYGSTAMPKRVFGEGVLHKAFTTSMEELAPAVWELNQVFLDIWDPTALTNNWVLPDNFHVNVKVMAQIKETVNFLNEPFEITREVNTPVEKGRSLSANVVHSLDGMIVREMTRRCGYDPYVIWAVREVLDDQPTSWKKDTKHPDDQMVLTLWKHYQDSGYLSARILDHLTHENMGHVDTNVIRDLVESLPAKPFTIMTVHDCFRCLPSYGNDLRAQYTYQLHLIAKSDMLSYLLSQLLGRTIQVNKMDPTLADDVLKANYALS